MTEKKRRLDAGISAFFDRYESAFNRTLRGDIDMEDVAALYASEFIAASSAGVATGRNDDRLRQVMAEGYARYRAMGAKAMRIRSFRLTPMDEQHCVAHVGWTASYARKDGADVPIEFDAHYLVQTLDGESKVFGWVSGDEEALLREHGII